MKHHTLRYLFFILATFAIPACSSENDGSDLIPEYGSDVIRFAVPTIALGAPEVRTRSTLLNAVTQNTTFGVFGYCVPYSVSSDQPNWLDGITEWAGKKEYSHADVMYNQPVFYDGDKCVYRGHETDPDLPKHWYTRRDYNGNINFEQFKYTFIAYHPFDQEKGGFSVTPVNANARGVPKLTYTMPYTAGGNHSRELAIDDVKDVMWAMKTDHMCGLGAVRLEFQHVMTGLRLQINNYNLADPNDANARKVTVQSIALEGDFYHSATIDFAPAMPEMTVSNERYAGTFYFLKATDSPLEIPANEIRVVGSTPENPDGTVILLLPNAAATASGATDAVPYLGENKTITITYKYEGDATPTTKHIRNFSLGRIPESGICYTLNLNFIGDQLLLMFTADSIEYWEPGSNNDIIIN